MGVAGSMPACRAGAFEAGLSHRDRVVRLYRNSLRTANDWCVDFDLFEKYALKIQAEFRANKDVSVRDGEYLVSKGLERLLEYKHPEPYVRPFDKGGTYYQRNLPPPPEFCEKSNTSIFR